MAVCRCPRKRTRASFLLASKMTEEQEVTRISDFLVKLPSEIRVHIYRKLPYEDTLRLRQVCRQTAEEVDQHLDFHVKIDQAYRGFRQLCRFRLRSCNIVHLTHQNLSRQGLFHHPNRMKKIIFDGNISTTNLYKVLSQCRNVDHLVFTHETLGIDNLLGSQRIQTCLQNLTSVTHLNLQFLRYPLSDPFLPEVNISSFLQVSFPHLTSFKLYFSVWGNWCPLFLFLQRHVGTLKDLELQVGDRGDSKNTEVYLQSFPHMRILQSRVNLRLLKSLRLREFRFRDDVLHLNSTVRNIFLDIIYEQKALDIFQFHSPGDITIRNLKSIILRNEKTLNEIVVYNLKSTETLNHNPENNNGAAAFVPQPQRIVVDMSIFSKCVNLKILALSCSSSNNPNHEDPVEMKMINLNAIPSSVERLHVNGFNFCGDDICHLSRNSPNLKELLVVDAGNMKYSTVLMNLLKNCPKLEYLNVRPVNSRANGDENWFREVSELSLLYNRFMGTSYDPIDDLDGFEAFVTESDREWIETNIASTCAVDEPT